MTQGSTAEEAQAKVFRYYQCVVRKQFEHQFGTTNPIAMQAANAARFAANGVINIHAEDLSGSAGQNGSQPPPPAPYTKAGQMAPKASPGASNSHTPFNAYRGNKAPKRPNPFSSNPPPPPGISGASGGGLRSYGTWG